MLEKMMDGISKRQVLKEVTDNIGKIEIENDQINCYVDAEKLSQRQKRNLCSIVVNGIPKDKYGEYYLRECGLYDTTINYIFSNIHFHNKLCISSYGKTNLVFDNCTFTDAIQIDCADNIIFKDNQYDVSSMDDVDSSFGTQFLISSLDKDNVNSISFCGDNVVPSRKNVNVNKPLNMILDLNAKNVEFTDTDFGDISLMKINSDSVFMQDSCIFGEELEINTNYMVDSGGNYISADTIIIDDSNKDYYVTWNMGYDNLFFNGVEFGKNEFIENDEQFELQKERVHLVDTLRLVYNKCNNDIDEKTEEIRNDMKQNSIGRVLKK